MAEIPAIYMARVEYLGGKSDKFYEMSVYADANGGFIEKRRWGRYGAKGQTKIVYHHSEWYATQSAQTQVSAKLNKGYTRPIAPLTRLATAMDN